MTPYIPEIRFADIDAMGHVNNAVYFSYYEQARIHFFAQLIGGGWDWKRQGILVARNETDYIRPVLFNDKVEIQCTCQHVGTKSFTISYEIKRGEELCAKGSTVLVCFDYEKQVTIAIPAEWKEKMEREVRS
jgi:acyl-CoA thioester hydrolase